MRQGQNKRMRGRTNNNRKGPNPLTRSFESNGPDVKIRGTAHHVAEKYLQLARDAQSSGDPVMAESYLQHAEHYFRLIATAQLAQQQAQNGYMRAPGELDAEEDDDDDGSALPDRFASPQPATPPPSQFQPPPQPFQERPQFASDNRQENRQDSRQDNRPETRPENRQDNRPDNRGDNRQDVRGPRPDRGFQDRNFQDRNGPDRGYQDRNFPDRPAPDRNGADRTVPDRQNQDRFNQNRNQRDQQRRPRDFRPDAPRQDTPRQDQLRQDAPRNDVPRSDQPRQEQPRQEQPRQEQPRQESPRQDPRPALADIAATALPAFITAPVRPAPEPVAIVREVPALHHHVADGAADGSDESPVRTRRRRRTKAEMEEIGRASCRERVFKDV